MEAVVTLDLRKPHWDDGKTMVSIHDAQQRFSYLEVMDGDRVHRMFDLVACKTKSNHILRGISSSMVEEGGKRLLIFDSSDGYLGDNALTAEGKIHRLYLRQLRDIVHALFDLWKVKKCHGNINAKCLLVANGVGKIWGMEGCETKVCTIQNIAADLKKLIEVVESQLKTEFPPMLATYLDSLTNPCTYSFGDVLPIFDHPTFGEIEDSAVWLTPEQRMRRAIDDHEKLRVNNTLTKYQIKDTIKNCQLVIVRKLLELKPWISAVMKDGHEDLKKTLCFNPGRFELAEGIPNGKYTNDDPISYLNFLRDFACHVNPGSELCDNDCVLFDKETEKIWHAFLILLEKTLAELVYYCEYNIAKEEKLREIREARKEAKKGKNRKSKAGPSH